MGDDNEGNDLSYIVHFTQADWARFSRLYDQHRKENDDWSEWWGERWENLYESIVADREMMKHFVQKWAVLSVFFWESCSFFVILRCRK